MTASLREAAAKISQATTPEDVFGVLDQPQDKALSRRFRFLASIVHPDRNPQAAAAAQEAFVALSRWYDAAAQKLAQGSYGQTLTLDLLLPTGDRVQSVDSPQQGDLSLLYRVCYRGEDTLFKLVRHGRNNDLLAAEAARLREIASALSGDPLRAHFPTLCDTVQVRDEAGVLRRANLLRDEAGYVSLADVLTRYPNGVHPADAAWMFNRLLAALGKTHALGLVHGAVVPEHVLIRPKDHHGMLIDWCYSVEQGETVKAISPSNRALYPPEVLQKRPASTATDLYMAAVTMLQLLGGDPATQTLPASVPKPMVALLRGCLLQAPAYRSGDAWELFDAFQLVLKWLYGEPTFRPFAM